MRRRMFLGLGASLIAGVLGWRLLRSSDEDAILAILEKRLGYLDKEPQGLRAFARDLADQHSIASRRLRTISMAAPLYRHLALNGNGALDRSIRHGEERVVSSYLLSSDFFLHGADEKRPVHYLGLYDPLRACANPFARIGDS
jgi:hypothetical protein